MGSNRKLAQLETVEYVDLQKFMGDWYVIANIPTFIEKGAVNAIESYRLDSEGRIKTTFTFRKDSVSGPEKKYNPTGFIYNRKKVFDIDKMYFFRFGPQEFIHWYKNTVLKWGRVCHQIILLSNQVKNKIGDKDLNAVKICGIHIYFGRKWGK